MVTSGNLKYGASIVRKTNLPTEIDRWDFVDTGSEQCGMCIIILLKASVICSKSLLKQPGFENCTLLTLDTN